MRGNKWAFGAVRRVFLTPFSAYTDSYYPPLPLFLEATPYVTTVKRAALPEIAYDANGNLLRVEL